MDIINNIHDFVLKHLIQYYESCKEEELNASVLDYISNKIGIVASHQFSTYLTYDNKKERKTKLKEFDNWLMKTSNDVFIKYRKRKIVKAVVNSKYLLLDLVAKAYLIKMKNGGH